MIELNLIPYELLLKNRGRVRFIELSILLALFVVLGTLTGVVCRALFSREPDVGNSLLAADVEVLERRLLDIRQARKESEKAQTDQQLARAQRREASLFMWLVAVATPKDVSLIEARLAEAQLEFSGVAKSSAGVSEFVKGLKDWCGHLVPVVERASREDVVGRTLERFEVRASLPLERGLRMWCVESEE